MATSSSTSPSASASASASTPASTSTSTSPTIRSRLTLVGTARAGNTLEARWIVGHPMETGFRLDDGGQRIKQNIITSIRVRVNDKPVLEMVPGTGLSSQPYFAFPVVVPTGGGTVTVEWRDDRGESGSTQQVFVLEP